MSWWLDADEISQAAADPPEDCSSFITQERDAKCNAIIPKEVRTRLIARPLIGSQMKTTSQ